MERSLTIQDKQIQTLMNLGLSLLQTKIYLSLAKLGKADIKTIAKASNVARQDIYRIMPSLEKMGLVEKILSKATMYKATPIKEGLTNLLQKQKEEYSKTERKINLLISNFHNNDLQVSQKNDPYFRVISEWTLLKKMHKSLINTAQTNIDITCPAKTFPKMLYDQLPHLKEAKKKGIKIRAITQDVGKKILLEKIQTLSKMAFVETRYLSNYDLFGMHAFDKKEITVSIFEPESGSSLWSNDQNVVKIAQSYFEHLWNESEQQKEKL